MEYIEIYVAENCSACHRVVHETKRIIGSMPNISLSIKNIKESKKTIAIVPAIFINNNLFCYGEFEKKKFLEILTRK